MKLSVLLALEFEKEMAATRAVLSRVPIERGDFTPHAKSMTLARLATHVAQLCSWAGMIMTTKEFDFSAIDPAVLNHNAASNEELLSIFEAQVGPGIGALREASDESLDEMWTLRSGEHEIFTIPRYMAYRSFMMNHVIHHRAQLTVYLRLLDIPLPPTYGPSADESM